jgi:hypothetical protein
MAEAKNTRPNMASERVKQGKRELLSVVVYPKH